MLESGLIAFIQSPVMMLVATRGPDGRAAVARGVGAVAAGDVVDLFVSRAQWPGVVDGCAQGAAIAATFCRPGDYRTYQLKGAVLERQPAGADGEAAAQDYMIRMRTTLHGLGVADGQIDHWLTAVDLVRVRFRPVAVFDQTPGPEAGRAVTGGVA